MLSEQKQDLAEPWRRQPWPAPVLQSSPTGRAGRGWELAKRNLVKGPILHLTLSVACIIYQPSPGGTRDHHFASAQAHPFQSSTARRKESGLEGFLGFPSSASVFFHTEPGLLCGNRDYHIAATSCFKLTSTRRSRKLRFVIQRSGCLMHSQPGH